MLFCASPVFKRIVAGLLVLLALPLPGRAAQMGIIEASRLNVRSGPSLQHRIVAVLEKGRTVTVTGSDAGWLKIQWSGHTGYVKNQAHYIRVVGFSDAPGKGGDRLPAAVKQVEQDAAAVAEKIKEGSDRIRRFTSKEKDAIDGLNDIDRALDAARHQVKAREKELTDIRSAREETHARMETLAGQIRESEGYAADRIVALYKLTWLGQMQVLASADSIYELMRREFLLSRILSQDRQLIETLARKKAGLQELLVAQKRQEEVQRKLEAELQDSIAAMTAKKTEREILLQRIRDQKSLQLASLAALKDFAKELDAVIEKLQKQPIPAAPSRVPSSRPFHQLKGLLKMPVRGKIVTQFGRFFNRRFNVMNYNSGIDIQADRGDPVRSVFAGTVLFSGWLKGYGNMLIIDHGDNYYSVYANNEDLFKEKGQKVETGEVIATVGDTGSRTGPKLYFELRHGGKPMDPMDWIGKG